MNIQKTIELNENLVNILTGLQEQIKDYEELFNSFTERQTPLIIKDSDIETEFDKIYEVIMKNQKIIEVENQLINTMKEFMEENSNYFSKVKNDRKQLAFQNNNLLDTLVTINKTYNKDERREKYLMEKAELEQLYIENDMIKQRREEKKRRKLEKEQKRIQLEKREKELKEVFQHCFFKDEKKPSKDDENKSSDYDYVVKILLIGDSGTGTKTSLMMRYVEDVFENWTTGSGVDFRIKTIQSHGKTVRLQIVCFLFYLFLF